MKVGFILVFVVSLTIPGWTATSAQTRDQQVRNDRDQIVKDLTWYYDDLDKGIAAAQRTGKPMMVVLRCIP